MGVIAVAFAVASAVASAVAFAAAFLKLGICLKKLSMAAAS